MFGSLWDGEDSMNLFTGGQRTAAPFRAEAAAEGAQARGNRSTGRMGISPARAITVLQVKFAQLRADIGSLAGGMRSLSDEVSALKTPIVAGRRAPAEEGLSAEFAELRSKVQL
jgi:hypothetical protein